LLQFAHLCLCLFQLPPKAYQHSLIRFSAWYRDKSMLILKDLQFFSGPGELFFA